MRINMPVTNNEVILKKGQILVSRTDLMRRITYVKDEFLAGIEQVNQAISQMDDITKQGAALAEQAAAGSIATSEQSANVTRLLRINSKGTSATSRPAVRWRMPIISPVRTPEKTYSPRFIVEQTQK